MDKSDTKKILQIVVLIFIAFFVGSILIVLSKTHLFNNLELRSIDYRFVLQDQKNEPSDKIIIIAMNDDSFDKLSEPFIIWPTYIAEISQKLIDNGAKVVGIDVLQEISLEKFSPGQTKKMQRALLSGKIVLISFLEADRRLRLPYGPFTAVAGLENIGLSNATPDNDGVIRRQPIHLEDPQGRQLPSFPLLILSRYMNGILTQGKDSIYRIGDKAIKDDKGFLVINYSGLPDTFPQIPFHEVLRKAQENDNDYFKSKFQDKIVLIGRTDIAGKDLFLTPFNVISDKKMSGIEIIANTINTGLQSRFLVPVRKKFNLIILFSLCLLITFICYYARTIVSIMVSLIILITYLFVAFRVFSHYGYILDVASPSLSIFISYGATYIFRYFTIEQKTRKMRNIFGKMVSSSIENELWKENIKVEPGVGVKKEKVTILFSDINNFTPLSEILSPEKLMSLLNEYFEEMVEIIFDNKGLIKQFVGDEIMVIYGAPGEEPMQALLAVKTAVEMVDRLQELSKKKKEPGFYSVKIGIHTGEMKVGFIGSSRRMEYTAVGKNVNLAARLEALNKQYSTFILISDETHSEIAGINDKIIKETLKDVCFEKLPPQKVKGFKKEVNIYKVFKEGWIYDEN